MVEGEWIYEERREQVNELEKHGHIAEQRDFGSNVEK